ncbi:hypothetical protein, partial [Aeromonas caviae]
CCNRPKGPHHQPVTAPIWRVPAGLWLAGRCEIGSGGALLNDGHVPRRCGRVTLMRGRAVAITLCVGLSAAAVAGALAQGTGDRGVSSLQCCNSSRAPTTNR